MYVCDPTRGDNTLDLLLCNRPYISDTYVQNGVFDPDHKQVGCKVRHVKSGVTLTSRHSAFNYKQTDFERLRMSLQPLPWDILDDMHVDAAVDTLYDFLNAAVSDCVPVVEIKRN